MSRAGVPDQCSPEGTVQGHHAPRRGTTDRCPQAATSQTRSGCAPVGRHHSAVGLPGLGVMGSQRASSCVPEAPSSPGGGPVGRFRSPRPPAVRPWRTPLTALGPSATLGGAAPCTEYSARVSLWCPVDAVAVVLTTRPPRRLSRCPPAEKAAATGEF